MINCYQNNVSSLTNYQFQQNKTGKCKLWNCWTLCLRFYNLPHRSQLELVSGSEQHELVVHVLCIRCQVWSYTNLNFFLTDICVGICGLQYFTCSLYCYTSRIKTSMWNYTWKQQGIIDVELYLRKPVRLYWNTMYMSTLELYPGKSIERNARLPVGLALWIVKACEFDFVFKLGAQLTVRVEDLID
jgi:hypothetical protein